MDETINIQIRGIYLERLLYWIVIIVLAVLLILAWMKEGSCTTDSKSTQGAQVAAPTQPTTPAATAPVVAQQPSAPKETCDDGIKNQDETATDCGGSCPKCGSGVACKVAADCIGGYCVNNSCSGTAPVVLSNKVEFTVSNVDYKKSATDTVKILGISYKITNGLADDSTGYVIKVYAKNIAGTRCLNQPSATSGTCDTSFAEFTSTAVKSGKSYSNTKTFDATDYTKAVGPYLLEDNGYDPADSAYSKFQIVAFLYDSDGNLIGGKTISSSYKVTP